MKIAVFGAGMIGQAIALDLAADFEITTFDLSAENLALLRNKNSAIHIKKADLSEYRNYLQWLDGFEIVVNAVPGFMGYKTLAAIINAGKNAVDISFFPENALELDSSAKDKNLTIITDCGIAPGLSNFIIGHYNGKMQINSLECYVGGLPVERKKPFEYKAPFSPIDVIEEYMRPARLKENNEIVTRPAMSEVETMLFDKIGELEAFNTDGLRSLLFTLPHIPNMKEKTLRYPGHANVIIALKQAGFFETSPLQIGDAEIIPLEFSSRILMNEWKLGPGEKEFTILKVVLAGEENGVEKRIEFVLLDHYDPLTGTTSMARTTGYTCTAAVNLVAGNLFREKGVFPPELVGKNKKCFDFVINYLKERNIVLTKEEK